jgi:regulator of protease activity HflC (stomatin/prohibitin superfamily)
MKEITYKGKEVNISKYFLIAGLIFFILTILFGSFYTIGAGERGIVLTFGKPDMVAKGEGLNFKIPLIQSIIKMDVKTLKYEAELSAASRDLQTVTTKIAINYRISPESVPELYRNVGINYAEKVIYPLEQEVNKATTAQFTAEELITKRDSVRETMKSSLKDKLSSRGIIIEEVSIINFDFSKSFNEAIESKVTAEQNALAAKNKLEQVKYEAEQTIAKAEAEAEALRLKKQSITQELVQLSQIEVQSKALDVQLKYIEKWNGITPTTLLQGNSQVMPTFNLN